MRQSHVYVVEGDGAVEIGVSTDLQSRLAQLQTGSPYPLRLAWSLPVDGDAYVVEADAHRLLDRHRIGGEWFAVPPDVAVAAISSAAYRVGTMAMVACPRCGNQISPKAVSCPRCGEPGERRRKGKSFLRWTAFVLFLGVCGILYAAYRKDEQNLKGHFEAVAIDTRTGRKMLDLSKPLVILAGTYACPSAAELDALQNGANSTCTRAPSDIAVTEMEMFGFLSPTYRVRPKFGSATDLFVPMKSLSNDQTQ